MQRIIPPPLAGLLKKAFLCSEKFHSCVPSREDTVLSNSVAKNIIPTEEDL